MLCGSPYVTGVWCMVVVDLEEVPGNPLCTGDILYIDPGGGYMSVHICKNPSLKMYVPHVYLNFYHATKNTQEHRVVGSCWLLPVDPRSLRLPLGKPSHYVVLRSRLTPWGAWIQQECMASVTPGVRRVGCLWLILGIFVPGDSSPCCSCHVFSGAASQWLVALPWKLGALMPHLSLTSIPPPHVSFLPTVPTVMGLEWTDLEPCRCDLRMRTPTFWSLLPCPLPGGPSWWLTGLSDTTCGTSGPLRSSPTGESLHPPPGPSFLSLPTVPCWWAPTTQHTPPTQMGTVPTHQLLYVWYARIRQKTKENKHFFRCRRT